MYFTCTIYDIVLPNKYLSIYLNLWLTDKQTHRQMPHKLTLISCSAKHRLHKMVFVVNIYLILSWKPPKTTSNFLHWTILWPLLLDGAPGALKGGLLHYYSNFLHWTILWPLLLDGAPGALKRGLLHYYSNFLHWAILWPLLLDGAPGALKRGLLHYYSNFLHWAILWPLLLDGAPGALKRGLLHYYSNFLHWTILWPLLLDGAPGALWWERIITLLQ